jgi:hypothetical protein
VILKLLLQIAALLGLGWIIAQIPFTWKAIPYLALICFVVLLAACIRKFIRGGY